MKSVSLILLLSIACLFSVCTMTGLVSENNIGNNVENMSSIKTQNSKGNFILVSEDKWGSFFYGLISGLTSIGQVNKINNCLPSQWRAEKVNAAKERKSNPQSLGIKLFLKLFSKISKVICRFKRRVQGLFRKRLHLRNRKMFLQMNEGINPFGFFLKLLKRFKNVAANINKIAHKVGHGYKNLWKKILGPIKKTVKRLKGFFNVIRKQLKKMINIKFIKKVIKSVVPCIKKTKSMARQLYHTVRSIVKKITTIASRGFAGLAQVFISILCNFKKFRSTINLLLTGLEEEDESRKYFYFGNFLGKLLLNIGKSRFLRMRLFLMKY